MQDASQTADDNNALLDKRSAIQPSEADFRASITMETPR